MQNILKEPNTLADFNAVQRLSDGGLQPLAELITQLGLAGRFDGDAVLHGADPIIRSPHRLGEASAIAQLLIGVAGAAIWQARTSQKTDVSIDIVDALHFLHPTHFVQQQGRAINVGAENVAVNDMFLTRDNKYIMLEAGPPYAKLLKGYTVFFECGDEKACYARAVAKWNADELEDALAKAGLPACRAFTREEWLEHPQGKLLAATPVIEIEKIKDGPPVPFPVADQKFGTFTGSAGTRFHACAGGAAQRPDIGRIWRRGAPHHFAFIPGYLRPASRRRHRKTLRLS